MSFNVRRQNIERRRINGFGRFKHTFITQRHKGLDDGLNVNRIHIKLIILRSLELMLTSLMWSKIGQDINIEVFE